MKNRFSAFSFRFWAVVTSVIVVGCTSEPKYDEPPKSENPAASAPGQPAGQAPGQYGIRSDKADEPK